MNLVSGHIKELAAPSVVFIECGQRGSLNISFGGVGQLIVLELRVLWLNLFGAYHIPSYNIHTYNNV